MGAASERCRSVVAAGWLAAAMAVGCAPAASAPGHSVVGKVTLGPMCGGPQREGQSCDIDYEAAEVRLLDSQGREVAHASTDAQGRFTLAGPAGRYTLRVMSPKVVRCADQAVSLPWSGGATLSVACDSGRR